MYAILDIRLIFDNEKFSYRFFVNGWIGYLLWKCGCDIP